MGNLIRLNGIYYYYYYLINVQSVTLFYMYNLANRFGAAELYAKVTNKSFIWILPPFSICLLPKLISSHLRPELN